MRGHVVNGINPVTFFTSNGLTAAARTAMRTSSPRRSGRGTSVAASALNGPNVSSLMAFMKVTPRASAERRPAVFTVISNDDFSRGLRLDLDPSSCHDGVRWTVARRKRLLERLIHGVV